MKNYEIYKSWEGIHHDYLTIIKLLDERDSSGDAMFLCRCDCGTEKKIKAGNVLKYKSCGCMRYKLIAEKATKHGHSKSRLYNVWSTMKSRCFYEKNRSYKNYGGRGITVCPEWANDFAAFEKWSYENGFDENATRKECTIERIDPNGNYEPSNCTWKNMKEQCNNKRNNHILTYKGETHTISEWAEKLGIKTSSLITRVHLGWSVERILGEPIKSEMLLEYHGVKKTIKEWAKEMGVLPRVMYCRKSRGWTTEEIIEGVRKCAK